MADLTEEQKMAHRKKESERRFEFKTKEVEHIIQYRKRKQNNNDKPVPELPNVPLAQNLYK